MGRVERMRGIEVLRARVVTSRRIGNRNEAHAHAHGGVECIVMRHRHCTACTSEHLRAQASGTAAGRQARATRSLALCALSKRGGSEAVKSDDTMPRARERFCGRASGRIAVCSSRAKASKRHRGAQTAARPARTSTGNQSREQMAPSRAEGREAGEGRGKEFSKGKEGGVLSLIAKQAGTGGQISNISIISGISTV